VCCPRASKEGYGYLKDGETGCKGTDYLALGVSHCFEKKESKLVDKFVVEPLTAGTLESLQNGARTAFKVVAGVTFDEATCGELSKLPACLQAYDGVTFGEDFLHRASAAARTWQRPHSQENLLGIVPVGEERSDWNFDHTRHKRILNYENKVSDDDNIKQDMSIDVYGRQSEEEAEAEAIKKLYDA